MQLVRDRITDFRGGLNQGAVLTEFPASQFPYALNGDALVNGRLRRRLGTRRTHTTRLTNSGGVAEGGFSGGTIWWVGSIAQRVVIMGDTAYYSNDAGATWNIADSSVGVSGFWTFAVVRVSGVDWLYAAGGNASVYRWNGSTIWEVAPGVPSSPAPRWLAVFNDRLYVAGHDGPNVQASAIGDPTDFTVPNGLVLPVHSQTDRPEIYNLYEVGPVLLVSHRESTSYISGFGRSDLIVATGATGISRSTGCLNARTMRSVGANSAIWLSGRGFEFYNGATISLISSPQIGHLLDGETLNLNDQFTGLFTVAGASAVYLADRQQYWCSIITRLFEWHLLKFDLLTKSWTVHRHGIRDTPPEFANHLATLGTLIAAPIDKLDDQEIMRPEAFGIEGWYRRIDDGDTDDASDFGGDGLPIEMEVDARPHVFGDLFARTRARQIRPSIKTDQSTAVVEVAAIVDGKKPGGPSVLTNPSFETGALAPWIVDGAGGTWSVGTGGQARTGSFYLQYDPASQTGPASAFTTAASAAAAQPAEEGEVWEFQAWVLAIGVAANTARADIIYRDSSDGIVLETFAPIQLLKDTYELLTIMARAPAGTAYVQGRLQVPLPGLLEIVRFDDARLRLLHRKPLTIPAANGDMPRQPIKARVNGRGRVLQTNLVTRDRVEIVGLEMRAEPMREP